MKQVTFTNGVPICPHCDKPTRRSEGMSTRTLMNFIPVYNEQGVNTNPDRNITTTQYLCHDCGKRFTVNYKFDEANYK